MIQIINIILNDIIGNSTCVTNDLLILSIMSSTGIYVLDKDLNLIEMSKE
jgi:hypothetical protein